LIEQGAAVFSAIHSRLHDSQGRVLKILGRLNRWYLDEQRKGEVVADLDIRKEDFASNTDVIPVSDPHIFSETQRMAQSQAVMQIMKENPDLFNRKVVMERFLKQIKVPGINELMKDVPSPEKRDSANENVAMMLGQAAFAYMEQDHLSHIQSHLDFYKDPIFGSNPMVQPVILPSDGGAHQATLVYVVLEPHEWLRCQDFGTPSDRLRRSKGHARGRQAHGYRLSARYTGHTEGICAGCRLNCRR
jgi:hypothetical protein